MSGWDQRQLCPDGACVGVIGSDGTCKVCGRAAPNWGDERKRGLIDPDAESSDASRPPSSITKAKNDALYFDVDPNEDDEDDDEDDDDGDEDEADEAAASPEWEQRKLCPDDACIGVIGDNGMCKVCGRAAEDNDDDDEPDGEDDGDDEEEDDEDDEDDDADEAAEEDAAVAHASTAAPGWDDRKLCSDEACTGLIGANGRCKVCNRSAA